MRWIFDTVVRQEEGETPAPEQEHPGETYIVAGAIWAFDPRAGRYRDLRSGQFLAHEAVMTYVRRSVEATSAVAEHLAGMVANGQLSAADWAALMWEQVKREHVRQYLLGIGGQNMMTAEHWGRVGGILSDQWRYFQQFSQEVAAGQLSELQIARRAQMYVNAAREAYERAHQIAQRYAGMTEERWVVNPPAEHCDDCLHFEAMGWQPLGTFPVPGAGQTQCLTNCQCHKEYRKQLIAIGEE